MIKSIELFGTTDVGQVRDHNEDNFVICKDLSKKEWAFKRDETLELAEKGAVLVVADGMGGTNAGEVASHIAQETVQELFNEIAEVPKTDTEREKILKTIIIKAHSAIVNHQHKNLDTAGMGTTLVIAWIIADGVHVAWSGDSRAYIFQGQTNMYPFTDDHSLVWQMVQEGQMTPEDARTHPESNIITQSLGDERSTPKPSAKSKKLYKGDKVLVCSDGLSGMLSDNHILQYMREANSPAEICKDLISAANKAGGTDNITALMLEVKEGTKRPALKEDPAPGKPVSAPTATQVLRKKNANKNIIIGLLAAAFVAVLAFVFWPKESPKILERISGKTLEFESKNALEINLPLLLLGNADMAIDSFRLVYKKEKFTGSSQICKLQVDSAQPGKFLVKLYPREGTIYYEAEVALLAKTPEKETVPTENQEVAPATQTPVNAENAGATGEELPNAVEEDTSPPVEEPETPIDNKPIPGGEIKPGETGTGSGTGTGVLTPIKGKNTNNESETPALEEEANEEEKGGFLP